MGLIHYTFHSSVLHEQTRIAVVLPTFGRGTKEEREAFYPNHKKFRTLYVLHGGSDDCTFYYRNTGIERYAQDGGFAVVFPEVRNSFYCDMAHGLKYLTYLTEELPRVVEALFPLSPHAKDRFVVGNSMGSHGTMKWALNRPEFFHAAAAMSGAGDVESMGFFQAKNGAMRKNVTDAFGLPTQYRDSKNDLQALARQVVASDKPFPRLFSCCGTEDPYYDGAKAFADFANTIGLPVEWQQGAGGHTWEFWDEWLRVIIDWMGIRNPIEEDQ